MQKIPVFGKSQSKMPINLTQYNQAYKVRLGMCLSIAKELVEIIDNKTCCKDCSINTHITLKVEKEKYHTIGNMVASILFSSGYLSSFIINKKGVEFDVKRMSEEQRLDAIGEESQEQTSFDPQSEEENPSTPPSC